MHDPSQQVHFEQAGQQVGQNIGDRVKQGCSGCGSAFSTLWLFFTLMYFFTSADAFPIGKWEFLWRFLAGPFNFLF